jgi:hypothetical protein
MIGSVDGLKRSNTGFRVQRQLQYVELVADVEPGLVHVRAPGELRTTSDWPARNRMDLAQVLTTPIAS